MATAYIETTIPSSYVARTSDSLFQAGRGQAESIDFPKPVMNPVITEVRRHTQEIAAAFDYDVMALARSLQQREDGDPRFKTPEGKHNIHPDT